jgi:hypothetical protein
VKFPAFLSSRLCTLCKQHDAKFTFRGRVKRDRQHDVCHRCCRSIRDRTVSQQLSNSTRARAIDLAVSTFYRQLLEQPWVRKAKTA